MYPIKILQIQDQKMKDQFKHLGFTISRDDSTEEEIDTSAKKLYEAIAQTHME